MTKWHADVVHMAKHMNIVGGPGPPKSGAALWADDKKYFFALVELCSLIAAGTLQHFLGLQTCCLFSLNKK